VPRLGFETGDDGRLGCPLAHQSAVAARSQRQPERIEQNRFASPGLAGERRQPGRKGEIEAIDQNDVADGEASEHRQYW
jgi:hypothetical protein